MDERIASSSLRGALSDVYFSALVSGEGKRLASRLGERSVHVHPLTGRAADPATLAAHLAELTAVYAKVGASYSPLKKTVGPDHDVTEGTLVWPGHELPAAVVVERRREREIAVCAYHDVGPFQRKSVPDGKRPVTTSPPILAPDVAGVLTRAVGLGGFETTATFSFPAGRRDEAGKIEEIPFPSLSDVLIAVDDGRAAVIVYRKLEGEKLLVLERGDSGLFSEVRFY